MTETRPWSPETGRQRLAVQLAFALALVGTAAVGVGVEAVPAGLAGAVVAGLVPLYFAVEDPENARTHAGQAVALAAAFAVLWAVRQFGP